MGSKKPDYRRIAELEVVLGFTDPEPITFTGCSFAGSPSIVGVRITGVAPVSDCDTTRNEATP